MTWGASPQLLVVISTQPSRIDGFEAMLGNLATQTWTEPYSLHVYYDGFKAVPKDSLLRRQRLFGMVNVSEEVLPNGPSGTVRRLKCVLDHPKANVVAFMDDDIIYPRNYLATGIAALNHQNGNVATVSFHGKNWRGRKYKDFERFSFLEDCPKAREVQAPGVGVSFSRASFVKELPSRPDFPQCKYACDLLFGFAAWQQGKTAIVLPHKKGWLRDFAVHKDAVCRTQKPYQAAAFDRMAAQGWLRP